MTILLILAGGGDGSTSGEGGPATASNDGIDEWEGTGEVGLAAIKDNIPRGFPRRGLNTCTGEVASSDSDPPMAISGEMGHGERDRTVISPSSSVGSWGGAIDAPSSLGNLPELSACARQTAGLSGTSPSTVGWIPFTSSCLARWNF